MSELEKLKAATERYNRLKVQLDEAASDVHEGIVEALKQGERPTDVADASPYRSAHVRRIARDNGIGPAPSAKRLEVENAAAEKTREVMLRVVDETFNDPELKEQIKRAFENKGKNSAN